MQRTTDENHLARRRTAAGSLALACALIALQWIGCAAGSAPLSYEEDGDSVRDEAPLGGEALAQRRMDLGRAWRDLQHFDSTMRSLVERKDSRSVAQLDGFLSQYMGEHLDPMLRPAWQSSHPEVMALDANLRFMKAQLLTDMRYTRRVQNAIEDIEDRYVGRQGMLVEYPVGEQRSLGEALELLREAKW
ncbi:MAG: hypothetical protein CL908_18395 [Deltaproteobacteria bacterium]|nr:hypothetical protein [Deltaproteobacteria bacterium]